MDKLKPCPFCGSNAKLMGGPMVHETYSVWCTGVGRHHMDYGFDKDTAIAAWNTRAAPKVKPLVWTAKGYAQTPFGKYLVVREDWSGEEDFWFICFAGKPYGKCGEHGSEEAAKAAAQADYERRILDALEPGQPVTVQEAAQLAEIDEQITQAELVALFGDRMPIEIAAVLAKEGGYASRLDARRAVNAAILALADGDGT